MVTGSQRRRLLVDGDAQLPLQLDEPRHGRIGRQAAGDLEDLLECLVALPLAQRERRHLVGVAGKRPVERDGQQFGVAECVADAVAGDRVAVVARVSDQGPARADRLAHLVGHPEHAMHACPWWVHTAAPARAAAVARMVSSTYRRGATSTSTPALCLMGRVIDSPPAWKLTCRMAGAPLSRTSSSRLQRWSWATPLRAIECVDRVSLGNDARSTCR
jgi:hypothetical protein